jgi:hypothetical protein
VLLALNSLPVAATLALARLLRVATPDCWRPDAVIGRSGETRLAG